MPWPAEEQEQLFSEKSNDRVLHIEYVTKYYHYLNTGVMHDQWRTGTEARNFIATVPKILDFKSSEQIFSENWRWVPMDGIWAASISHTNSPMWPVFRRWLHARDSSHILHYRVASLHKITSTESLAPSQLLCRVNSMRKTRNWSLNFHTHIREFKITYRPKDMEIN